ncbi:MAG: hypothetical protein KFF49_08995 [Bacteroidales bacterium]|nr:hypothetical protein [Bacteroidales bacterium]
MKNFLITVILILSSLTGRGGEVHLSGYAPGAAGSHLEIYHQPDPVTGQYFLISRIEIPAKGEFEAGVACDDLCWLRLRYGVSEFSMLVREGQSYELRLPPYKEMTRIDRLNPFFEYRVSHIRLEGADDLNNTIKYIDSLYYDYTGRITRSIYLGKVFQNKDSLLRSFVQLRTMLYDDYSVKYHNYRHCLLKMVAEKQVRPAEDDIELINREFIPAMPAYAELVNQVFNAYIRRLASSGGEDSLRVYINAGNKYRHITDILGRQGLLENTSLMDFILLSNLYKEYHSGGFRKEGIESIFEWISENAADEYNRQLAAIITDKINRLKPGTIPPAFRLMNNRGNIFTLDSLRGKLSILGFGTAELPGTRTELELIKSWAGDYRDEIRLVMIMLDEDFKASMDRVANNNEHAFIFLDGSASDRLLTDYDIRYLPVFYLLDRETKLIRSPAPLPSENLRSLVIKELKDSLMDDIRD